MICESTTIGNVFIIDLMASYQRNFTGRFCRLSSILDVDMHLAQQALREVTMTESYFFTILF